MDQTVPAENLNPIYVRNSRRIVLNSPALVWKMKIQTTGWIFLFALLTATPVPAQDGTLPGGGHTAAGGVGATNVNASRWKPDFFRRSFGPTTPFETPGIGLEPFFIDHRHATNAVIDLSFLLDAPAGRDGFIRARGDQLVKENG